MFESTYYQSNNSRSNDLSLSSFVHTGHYILSFPFIWNQSRLLQYLIRKLDCLLQVNFPSLLISGTTVYDTQLILKLNALDKRE